MDDGKGRGSYLGDRYEQLVDVFCCFCTPEYLICSRGVGALFPFEGMWFSSQHRAPLDLFGPFWALLPWVSTFVVGFFPKSDNIDKKVFVSDFERDTGGLFRCGVHACLWCVRSFFPGTTVWGLQGVRYRLLVVW